MPSTAVSGVYIAHLVRNDTGGESHITFVVRDDSSHSDIVLQTSDATWQAYNTYGGNSLYQCTVACPPGDPHGYKAAYKVSYNRPFNTAEDDGGPLVRSSPAREYPMIRFLEAQRLRRQLHRRASTSHRRGALLRNHKLFISSGHDEYWSATQRTSMEPARDAGVNLAFFTGNEGFWKTRWEPSADGDEHAGPHARLLQGHALRPSARTRSSGPAPGATRASRRRRRTSRPENALTGQSFLVNSGTSRITVPVRLRPAAACGATPRPPRCARAERCTLAPDTLGYEWDEDADNGFRPAGQFRLSSTTVSGLEVFTDYGSTSTHRRRPRRTT